MKNRRSLASRLFSPVSLKGLRYANYTAAVFVILFAGVTAALLSQLEHIVASIPGGVEDIGGAFVLHALFVMKILIPATLVGTALFVLFGEIGRSRQLQSELVAIMAQIKSLQDRKYSYKRVMRKHDELQPVMEELHRLADQLNEST